MTRRIAAIAGVVILFGATAAVAIAIWPDRTGNDTAATTGAARGEQPTEPLDAADGIRGDSAGRGDVARPARGGGSPGAAAAGLVQGPDLSYSLRPMSGPAAAVPRLKHPPLAGVLFDLDSGRILWQRHASLQLPIASLTKMMTALIVAGQDPPGDRVRISRKAAGTPGSATGLLPRGHKVPLEPLLQALIMISANDAAVALAQHDAGTVASFVKEMNARAAAMGLSCTHYSTPNGLRDRNNYSCPLDIAALARADLANPTIARIARTRYAKPRFPIKGRHLYLSNNHYFLQRGLSDLPQARVTGLKTGFTDRAGRCYVTTAAIGGRRLGVVLLHSPNPLTQVPVVLRAGFEAEGAIPPAASAGGGGRAAAR